VSIQPLLSRRATLPAIITAARAGALGHAWNMFDAGGYDRETGDAGALAVKGRLLKDRALAAAPDARPALFAEAAHAYAAADALSPQPYTRINVATLTLLAGDATGAATIAGDLIAWMDVAADVAETPYYLAATRAEAELLRGHRDAAEALLAKAIGHDPDGWADHASTLRQFGLILSAQRAPADWLNRYRPPRSLHYAGHLAIAADDHAALSASVAGAIASSHIGFGYGALAAGADIVIAEQLLAAGAELHVVLPTAIDIFVAQSVAPYGADWEQRFQSCLAAATGVRSATGITGAYEPLATQLAADIAMGAAVLNARLLESSAVQLLVVDDGPGTYGEGRGTARDGTGWAASGRAQTVIVAPRTAPVAASGRAPPEGRPDRRLAAMLHIAFDGIDALDDGAFAEMLDTVIAPFRARIAASPITPDVTLPAGNGRIVGFATPEVAWAYAAPLLAGSPSIHPLRIAAHYALAHWLTDPAALVGPGVAELGQIAAVALPGTITASEAFATALMAAPHEPPRAEPIGEVGNLRLFALSVD
jgi:hypothetical protein